MILKPYLTRDQLPLLNQLENLHQHQATLKIQAQIMDKMANKLIELKMVNQLIIKKKMIARITKLTTIIKRILIKLRTMQSLTIMAKRMKKRRNKPVTITIRTSNKEMQRKMRLTLPLTPIY